jgi:hypothetical protein
VPTELHLDPELAEIVARARVRAEEAGELPLPTGRPFENPLSAEEQQVLRDWIDSGGYAASVAAVIAEDPELANEWRKYLSVVVDDNLLLSVLAGQAPADLMVQLAEGGVLTTGAWYYRLARAAKRDEDGVLSRQLQGLSASDRDHVRHQLEELPSSIGLIGLRRVVPVMAALHVRRNFSTLAAEALAVALLASAEIAVRVDTPLIRAGAEDLGISSRLI